MFQVIVAPRPKCSMTLIDVRMSNGEPLFRLDVAQAGDVIMTMYTRRLKLEDNASSGRKSIHEHSSTSQTIPRRSGTYIMTASLFVVMKGAENVLLELQLGSVRLSAEST